MHVLTICSIHLSNCVVYSRKSRAHLPPRNLCFRKNLKPYKFARIAIGHHRETVWCSVDCISHEKRWARIRFNSTLCWIHKPKTAQSQKKIDSVFSPIAKVLFKPFSTGYASPGPVKATTLAEFTREF